MVIALAEPKKIFANLQSKKLRFLSQEKVTCMLCHKKSKSASKNIFCALTMVTLFFTFYGYLEQPVLSLIFVIYY